MPMRRKLLKFKLIGASYKGGVRLPGYSIFTYQDETGHEHTKTFPESTSPAEACKILNGIGVDTSILDGWVRTGRGAAFTLS